MLEEEQTLERCQDLTAAQPAPVRVGSAETPSQQGLGTDQGLLGW